MSAFEPPAAWRDVLRAAEQRAAAAGARVWVVGGTVRDALLGRETRDLDLAVDAPALEWARGLAESLAGHVVELDGERSVARIILDGRYVDVAQLRGTIEEDLARRDLTVDALAASTGGGAVVDVTGGLADLAERRVRMTSARALDDDPLRMLRAVRITCELGFTLDAGTAGAIQRRAESVARVSAERVRDELAQMFGLGSAYAAVRMLDELQLLDRVLPELSAGRGVEQPDEWHVYDVFEHNLRTVEALDDLLAEDREGPRDRGWIRGEVRASFAWRWAELRAYFSEEITEGRTRGALTKLAALLHDVGKPATRSADATGRIRFFGHADEGGAIAARIMRRLRFSTQEARFVRLLVAEHLRPVQLAPRGQVPTRRALYRFYRALGVAMPAVLFVSLADAAASQGARLTRDGWAVQVRYMNGLLVRSQEEEGIVSAPRLLTGRDIMRDLGIEEGPQIGRLLEALREAQAAGGITDTDGALGFVREMARRERWLGVERG